MKRTVRTWWEWRLELVHNTGTLEPPRWQWVRVLMRSEGQ